MHHIPASALTHTLQQSLSLLVSDCRKAEPITLSLPEDADDFLVIFDPFSSAGTPFPLALLAICRVSETLWECYAFTHPRKRRQGLFSQLLEGLCSLASDRGTEDEIQLVFLSDHKSQDGMAAAKALDMELWYSEYQMELPLCRWKKAHPISAAPVLFLAEKTILEKGMEIEARDYYAYPASSPSPSPEPVGTCRLLPYSHSRFYLYHVEIFPVFRGKGLGQALLQEVFSRLPADGTILLQVSSDNAPALSLYKKTGFRITETLSYYLY